MLSPPESSSGPAGRSRGLGRFPIVVKIAGTVALLAIPGSLLLEGQDKPAAGQPVSPTTQGAAPAAAPAAPATHDYILQRGDDLEVQAFNNDELRQKAKIRPDGKISVLLLGDVPAAGLTPGQLAETLVQGYSKLFRNPRISINVTSFSNQSVFVGGEVQTPKLLPFNGRLTVTGALFSAGGLKTTANANNIILLRDSGKGTPIVSRLSLSEVMKKGQADVELAPFDVVFVPRSKIGRVDQFVDQWVKQLLPVTVGFGFSYLFGQQPLIQ